MSGSWVRRFVVDPGRAEEMASLYRSLGFETRLEPPAAHDLSPGCGECPIVRHGLLRTLFTRRPRAEGHRSS